MTMATMPWPTPHVAMAPAQPMDAMLPLIGIRVSAEPPPNPAAVRPAANPLLSGNHLTALATVAM